MSVQKKLLIYSAIMALLCSIYFVLDAMLYTGMHPKLIRENKIQASYFVQNKIKKKATLVFIGGGQWGDYWGQELALEGYVGLSLPYIGREGLPKTLEEIPLEYFENALIWLQKQPEVDPNKIIVMGASRNAELALLLASVFPNLIHGVVAYAPSSVVWSNRVLPYNSNKLKASWTYQGLDIPYIPMEKIAVQNSQKIATLPYWKEGLEKTKMHGKAIIQVENIQGPILLFSGKDDQVWPATFMANMIKERALKNNFKYPIESIQYENTGHLISNKPGSEARVRNGIMAINGKDYNFKFGGTIKGDSIAKIDAYKKVLAFVKAL